MAITAVPVQKPQADAPETAQPSFDKSKITDTDSAADQLVSAGLFAKEFPEEQAAAEEAAPEEIQPGETRGNDAPEETPASDHQDPGQSEPHETAAIEPPVSWTAEEKSEFAALPLATQQAILRRESERDRGISTRLQEAAERNRQLDAQLQQTAAERANISQMLRASILQLNPELVRFQSVDWDKLAVDNPAEWARQRQAYDSVNGRMQTAIAQLQVLDQQQQQESQRKLMTYRQEEFNKLIQKIPEFNDPAKVQAENKELMSYLSKPDIGYTEQELLNIYDHRAIVIARKAMLYDKMIAAKNSAVTKKVPPSNVRQLRPGVKPPQGAKEEADTAKARALRDNLRKTGSTQAAADYLETILGS